MFDQPAPVRRQRVEARAGVAFRLKGGRTVLDRLAQQGSAKAMLPRVYSEVPEVVFLNTAGGLTGGDRIAFDLELAPGTQAVATTQTAERAYASLDDLPPARLDLTMRVGAGARLDWLPQETILFDTARLHRRMRSDLEGDAELLFCEAVTLGRAAMGETLAMLDFRDTREIRRDGRPVLVEPLRITTDTLRRRDNPALFGGAAALATVALVAGDAPDRMSRVQGLDAPGVTAAASGWDGKLVIRGMSASATLLRRWLYTVLTDLRAAPLPRVWTI